MSAVDISLHSVARVSISTVKRGPHDGIKDDYVVHHITIHYADRDGHLTRLNLNLYGQHGLTEVPFMFGAVVDETAKVKEDVQ